MRIVISSPVYPTEDIVRVERGLTNIFTKNKFDQRTRGEILLLVVESSERNSLDWLRQYIHELRIIDATRARLLANWNGSSTILRLDKQTACIGKVRVIDDSEESPPLGCIEIELAFDDEKTFTDFVSWFTPRTKDGRVVRT